MPTSTGTYNTSTITYDQSSLSYDGFPAPLSGMPALGVFVAWTDGPYVASPAWTEITPYVRQINIRRGRQDDLQQFPPGTAQLVLDNRDRLFDPFNTAGANYANLKPRKQIRIVANWNSVEYPLYRGYIAGWPVEYTDAGFDSTVTIDCFDALGLMANETVPADWLTEYTQTLNPYLYFTGAGSQGLPYLISYNNAWGYFNDSGGVLPNFYEVPSLMDGVQGTAKYCMLYSTYMPQATASRADFSVSGYTQFAAPGQVLGYAGSISGRYGDTTAGLFFYYDNDAPFVKDTLYVRQQHQAAGSGKYYRAGITTSTAQGFYFVLNYTGATDTPTLYINGVQVPLTYIGVDPSSGLVGLDGISNLNCALSQFALHSRLLTATEIATLGYYAAARLQETTTERMQRLLGATSFPSALQSLTGSPEAQVSEIGDSAGVVPEMQKITDSEGGELFVSDTGILTFYERDYFATRTRCNTSQMTFTDTGVGVGYDAQGIRIDYDADRIRNDINIRLSGGGVVSNSDSASISSFGAAEWTVETVLSSTAGASTLAARLTTLYKNPKMAIEPFMSKGQKDPSYNWPRLLALELLDRVTFKRTPAIGSAIVKDLLVQSIEHRITPGEWQTVVNGSARYTNWFILGVSRLGSDDLLLN